MKIAFILPGKYGWHGARYKYFNLFEQIPEFDIKLFKEVFYANAKAWKPRYFAVWGDIYPTFNLCVRDKWEYILLEHDVTSMRAELTEKAFIAERNKIIQAKKIIFTSPAHREYVLKKYAIPEKKTFVLYLRPLQRDLLFQPLPKLKGRNVVYAGGLMGKEALDGKYGYRFYTEMFRTFINFGWNVHLYPIRKAPKVYEDIGCVYHDPLQEGVELYRELSQYTASLQIFNFDGVNKKAYDYCQKCYPNKLWLGLAAGIPTIGINGGEGMDLYNHKWGIVLKDLKQIPEISDRIKYLDLKKYRETENIESQLEELKKFILTN